MALTLDAKDVGHGVNIERYTNDAGSTVAIQVATDGDTEYHYQVIDRNGNRSGVLYSRESAMYLAEYLTVKPNPDQIPNDGMGGLDGNF